MTTRLGDDGGTVWGRTTGGRRIGGRGRRRRDVPMRSSNRHRTGEGIRTDPDSPPKITGDVTIDDRRVRNGRRRSSGGLLWTKTELNLKDKVAFVDEEVRKGGDISDQGQRI
jgi:hypothetical protein